MGLNTGGMGTFSPSPFYTEKIDDFAGIYLSADHRRHEGRGKGFCRYIICRSDAYRGRTQGIEFNAFGDPEAQVVLQD